ncbi:MAG: LuxR C-terminal-related transcriptional regulator [Oscillospiraceae bacterium]|nr:LuxR C-terminal-related transcriptional regulator [Oscillospiraceae bacterium]
MNAVFAFAPREQLAEQFDKITKGNNLLYVQAPAGHGKTVAVELWLARKRSEGVRTAWITLDEYDNRLTSFCRRLVTVLSEFQPGNAVLRQYAAHPAFDSAPDEFAVSAASAFAEDSRKYTIVFDDLHKITNEKILSLIAGLHRRRRAPGRAIVCISRGNVPNALRTEDCKIVTNFCFTADEIREFFILNRKHITLEQAENIHKASSGGWAISMRSLMLSGTPLQTEHNDETPELYFEKNVWSELDEKTQGVLMKLPVVAELNADVFKALTDIGSGDKILETLKNESLFLNQIDHMTYRFHDLFRDFLLTMLQKCGEKAVAAQQIRAGDYYFGRGDYFRAVEHYKKGSHNDMVSECLYNMYDYNSPFASIEDTLHTIHSVLDDSIVENKPFLLEVQAWAAYMEGRIGDFERILDKYHKLFPKIIVKSPRSVIARACFRFIDRREDRINFMKTLRSIPFKGLLKVYTPSVTNNMPFFHRSIIDYSDMAIDTDNRMTLLEKSLGVLISAEYAVIRECIYAGINYEKGNMSAACEHAMDACSNIAENCSAEIKFCAMYVLAAALRGSGQDSCISSNNIDDMIEKENAHYLKSNFLAGRVRLKLADGDEAAARKWLEFNSENMQSSLKLYKIFQYFTTARAYIVLKNYNTAILFLKKLLKLSEDYNRPLDIIEARILLSVAYWKKTRGGQDIALRHMSQAADLAYEYGYVQQFANAGADIVSMLHRLERQSVQKAYTGKAPFEFIKKLYTGASAVSKRRKGFVCEAGRTEKNMIFTEKQKTVMRLMCQGLGRREIADKMGLKPYGVKSHMELIYKKLDVPNGTEAVIKINELGLVE